MISKRVPKIEPGPLIIDARTLNNYTTTRIFSLGLNVSDHEGIHIHQAETDFGTMHLCVLQVEDLIIAQRRVALRQKYPRLFPVLYEHILIETNDSLTLVLLYQLTFRVKSPKIEKCIVELTEALTRLDQAGLEVQQPLLHIYQSALSQQYYLDFLAVGLKKLDEKVAVSKYLKSLAAQDEVEIASRVYLLEDQVYRWKVSPRELLELSERTWMTWMAFSVLMNLPFVKAMEICYRYGKDQPLKRGKVEDLAGPVIIEGWEVPALFKSGKCVEQYEEYSPEVLRQRYFEPQKTYRVSKTNNVTITKQDNSINKNQSFAIIEDSVQKIECVEFFIVYMKYFQLTIEKIHYRRSSNQLQLTLAKGKYAVIRFPNNYSLRQEQLAIVMGKSTLQNCTLSLPGSLVSDKLLILLSNLDKTADLRKIDFSYCPNFSQFGLTNLFQSHLCHNLVDINLSGTHTGQTTIQSIKALPNLRNLLINNCKKLSSQSLSDDFKGISLHKIGLQVLEAVNTVVMLNLNARLRILKLTVQFPIEQLRILSKMPLEQLRLRLIQNRKQQIMSFVNSIYSLTSYTRQFCQGTPGKTLKSVDFSDSQIRYKLIRSILQIKTVTQVRLNGCTRLGDQYDHMGGDVELVELRQAILSARNLKTMIDRIVFVRYLDLRGSSLDRRDITDVIQSIGKQMNQVLIDQQQYSSQLLTLVNKPKGSSINKLTVRIHSSLNEKFLSMVYNVSKGNKLVNFQCQQSEQLRIAKRIVSFLGLREKLAFRIRSQQLSKILSKPPTAPNSPQLSFTFCRDLSVFAHKVCLPLPQPLLHINLSNNRFLPVSCIHVLNAYASQFVRSIDFRGCLFTFDEVALMVCEWPNLVNVNEGEFAVKWGHKMFPVVCQKMLKFFMRLQKLTTLAIEVRKVREVQLLFSILYYVVNHHKPSLTVFKLSLSKINMQLSKDDCTEFWDSLLTTITLRSLSIQTSQCTNFQKHHYRHLININRLNLLALTMRLPPRMPFYPKLTSLATLRLFVNEYFFNQVGEPFVNDAYLAEVVKPCEGLEYLEMEFNGCMNVTHLEKLAGQIKGLRRLKTLSLSLEYCPLRHNVIPILLDSLKQLRYLNRFSLNISFTHQVSDDITVALINIGQALNLPYIEIIGFNVFRRGSLQFELEMQQNNIRVVY